MSLKNSNLHGSHGAGTGTASRGRPQLRARPVARAAQTTDPSASQAEVQRLTHELRTAAAVVELMQLVNGSEDTQEACQLVASSLHQHLRCEQVLVGMRRGGAAMGQHAISTAGVLDKRSEFSRRIKTVLVEAMTREELGVWPPMPGHSQHQLLGHRKFAGHDRVVVSVPLRHHDEVCGALAFVFRRENFRPASMRFAAAVSEPIGSALQVRKQQDGNWAEQLLRACVANRLATRRRLVALGMILFAALLLAPAPHRVTCSCVTTAAQKRVCAAPHDGVLESTFVRPGESVSKDQLLAVLDGRELRTRVAETTAELSRARKRHEVHVARHETADALLAGLKCRQLEHELKELRHKQDRLEIRSPMEGIVLSGLDRDQQNFPVSAGNVLYTIAPLDNVCVEVELPARDIAYVDSERRLNITLDGVEGDVFSSALGLIRPEPEIRTGENVFVAEALLANDGRALRPGMRGTARVDAGQRTVGWLLFHRAWDRARSYWPWLVATK